MRAAMKLSRSARTDRLTALDSSFLHIEDSSPAHMHVAGVMIFEGEPPSYDELVTAIESRLDLVPRYRQKLAFPPGPVFRPRWVDDPHLNLRYHVRVTALPSPGEEEQLRALAGRVFSQRLDRDKPLWELWLVEGLEGGRFAVLSKTHHALVDGISGVDIVTVLLDLDREPAATRGPARQWLPRPEPAAVRLLTEAVFERAAESLDIGRGARRLLRARGELVDGAREAIGGIVALAGAGLRGAPATPYNEPVGPHRRFTWVRASLEGVKAVKNALGGTVNDVVLATVAGSLRRHLTRRGYDTRELELKAMVPVSVRVEEERGALGNRVASVFAPLPVDEQDPIVRLRTISEAMRGLKEGRQAVGAQVLTELGGFAPPNLMAQGTRLMVSARLFNLTVTNVPGPQLPLYLLGRELAEIFPMVPLAPNHALGVAIMSYRGGLYFGLVGDWDLLYDLEDLAGDFERSLAELARAAGVKARSMRPPAKRPAPKRPPAAVTPARADRSRA
jgi:diacylglycerol O-acyltransferase